MATMMLVYSGTMDLALAGVFSMSNQVNEVFEMHQMQLKLHKNKPSKDEKDSFQQKYHSLEAESKTILTHFISLVDKINKRIDKHNAAIEKLEAAQQQHYNFDGKFLDMRAAFAKEVDNFTQRQQSVLQLLNSRTYQLQKSSQAMAKSVQQVQREQDSLRKTQQEIQNRLVSLNKQFKNQLQSLFIHSNANQAKLNELISIKDRHSDHIQHLKQSSIQLQIDSLKTSLEKSHEALNYNNLQSQKQLKSLCQNFNRLRQQFTAQSSFLQQLRPKMVRIEQQSRNFQTQVGQLRVLIREEQNKGANKSRETLNKRQMQTQFRIDSLLQEMNAIRRTIQALQQFLRTIQLNSAKSNKDTLQFFLQKAKEIKARTERTEKRLIQLQDRSEQQGNQLIMMFERRSDELSLRYEQLVHAVFDMCTRLDIRNPLKAMG